MNWGHCRPGPALLSKQAKVTAPSAGFVGVKHGTHFLNMCSMGADRFMELRAAVLEFLYAKQAKRLKVA